jgi:hypothetical protein
LFKGWGKVKSAHCEAYETTAFDSDPAPIELPDSRFMVHSC